MTQYWKSRRPQSRYRKVEPSLLGAAAAFEIDPVHDRTHRLSGQGTCGITGTHSGSAAYAYVQTGAGYKSHTRGALLMEGHGREIYIGEHLAVKCIFHSTDGTGQHLVALHRFHSAFRYNGPRTDWYKMRCRYNNLPAWMTAHHTLHAGR